jgi:hypothetical protein
LQAGVFLGGCVPAGIFATAAGCIVLTATGIGSQNTDLTSWRNQHRSASGPSVSDGRPERSLSQASSVICVASINGANAFVG